MKVRISVEINIAAEKLAAFLANPRNNQKWMTDLQSYEPLSGTPGKTGFTYALVFKSGNREMAFTVTATKVDLPRELSITMKSPMVDIDAVGTLTPLSSIKTSYTLEQNFQFKGLMQTAFGFLAGGMIKKQQQTHLEALKRYVEAMGD